MLIFEESPCGCTERKRDMTHNCALFKGLKSIVTDGCFLSGPNHDYSGHMDWPTGCHVNCQVEPHPNPWKMYLVSSWNRVSLFGKGCIFGNHLLKEIQKLHNAAIREHFFTLMSLTRIGIAETYDCTSFNTPLHFQKKPPNLTYYVKWPTCKVFIILITL